MRTIQDDNLEIWEVYASAGAFGFPDRSRIVFHSLSDRFRRARAVERDADKAGVEHEIAMLPEGELARLLASATDVE